MEALLSNRQDAAHERRRPGGQRAAVVACTRAGETRLARRTPSDHSVLIPNPQSLIPPKPTRVGRFRGLVLTLALLCLGLAGCRTDPNILALERENRELDDQVWYLSDQLDIALQKLESTKTKLTKCQEKAKDKDADAAAPGTPERAGAGRSGSSLRGLLAPGAAGKNGTAPDEIATPEIVVPSEALPPGQVPKSLQRSRIGAGRSGDPGEDRPASEKNGSERPTNHKPAADKPGPEASKGESTGEAPPRTMLNPPARKVGRPSLRGPRDEQLSSEPSRLPALKTDAVAMPSGKPYRVVPVGALSIEAAADSAKVQSITLHRLLTGGLNVDGQPGDEGISVLVEPRDAQGNLVAAAGAVSLLALDPEAPREQARVARWDLAPGETARMFRRMALGASGLSLELLWPGEPPRHGRLDLFVRYTTSDGRELESRQQLNLTPPAASNAIPVVLPAAATVDATPIASSIPATEKQRGDAVPQGEPSATRSDGESPAAQPAAGPTSALPVRIARPSWSPNRS